MNRRETLEFVNICMVYDGEKVLVQDRVSPDWPGITFPGGHVEHGGIFYRCSYQRSQRRNWINHIQSSTLWHKELV
ncbi:hydrolase, NUDIX family [Streptococcus sanguinis]|nr:hydrolase, NUDIX family [Streptococcus sanguinis]